MSKWNAQPYIGEAIDARLNNTPGYQENLAPGSNEQRIFSLPVKDMARTALYEARNSNQTEEFTARWASLLRIQATTDPFGTAYDLTRDAHKSLDDDVVSRTGAKVFGEIVTKMVQSPDPVDKKQAFRLVDKAQEWLDWSFNCLNDWGREKKAQSELSQQLTKLNEMIAPFAPELGYQDRIAHAHSDALLEKQIRDEIVPVAAASNPAVAQTIPEPIKDVVAPAKTKLFGMPLPVARHQPPHLLT